MNVWRLTILLSVGLVTTGCFSLGDTHLVFVEEAHFGLKANVSTQNYNPYEVDLGFRRGVVASIPKQASEIPTIPKLIRGVPEMIGSGSIRAGTQGPIYQRAEGTIVIEHDPDELMSLYTRFQANIDIGDPVKIKHFLATGMAANYLLSNENILRGAPAFVDLMAGERKRLESTLQTEQGSESEQ